MFAGPNGSGKSTLKLYLAPFLHGVYINPDEIEAQIQREGFLNLTDFKVVPTQVEVQAFFRGSKFLEAAGYAAEAQLIDLEENRLAFNGITVNSYLASVAADFIRTKLLDQKISFSFETVMSHPGKLDILRTARKCGYRTYLYYVATDDPNINISRVKNRVARGGHSVPEDKIIERYHRSIAQLADAISLTDRAYIFDNSKETANQQAVFLAEVTGGSSMRIEPEKLPLWFLRAALDIEVE